MKRSLTTVRRNTKKNCANTINMISQKTIWLTTFEMLTEVPVPSVALFMRLSTPRRTRSFPIRPATNRAISQPMINTKTATMIRATP